MHQKWIILTIKYNEQYLHLKGRPHSIDIIYRNPTLAKCRGEAQNFQNWGFGVPGTPECSKLDSKAQNTSHLSVLGVIGKVLKRRYRKWPRIDQLDICSPSYGQKKDRESNWQFDSWPLKVRNRHVFDVRSKSATWRWKDLDEGYKIGLDLVSIGGRDEELWLSKVPGLQPGHIRDNFGTPFRESREKEPFGCSPRGRTQSIL